MHAVVAEPVSSRDRVIGAMDHPAPPPGFAPEDANWQTTANRPTGPAATEGHSAGAGSLSSDGSDPWVRRDPWTRLPAQENVNTDYLQFLQWRQGLEAGPATPPTGAQVTPPVRHDFVRLGAQPELHPLHWGQAAREEAERTTAGPPPEWDGAKMEFRDYKIKAKLWLRTTRTPPTARGPMLLKGLTGPPWEHMKFLAADDGWLDNPDNGRILINLMDTKEYYGEEERESMLAACSRITFHLRRAKGEKAQAFMLRWDDAERRVKEKGVNLPGEYQGFLLVTALQLTSDQIKLLLNYTRGSLQVSDVKAWLRIHETDLDITTLGNDKKKSTNEVHTIYEETVQEEGDVLDIEGDLVQDEDTEMLLTTLAEMSDGENDGQTTTEISEGEAKEVLLTMLKERPRTRSFQGAMKAKKNRDLARGFGAGRDGALRPGTYKVSIEELKRRTKCHRCQEVGHWSRECPNKGQGKGDGKPKDIHYITAETSDEIEFLYLDADAASHSDPTAKDTQAEFVYMSVPPIITHEILTMETSVEAGCATIDTGCQRMAIGLDALERYQNLLPPELFIRFRRERHQFRSVHQTSCTERVAIMPNSLGPRGSYLKPAIFEDEPCRSAPFLISLPFLLHCGIQLHLDPTFGLLLRSKKLGFSARCHLGPTGALRVFLQDFSEDQIRRLAGTQDSKHVEYELLRTEHSAGSTETARSSHPARPASEHAEPPQNNRTEAEESISMIRAWYRMVLRLFVMITQALRHQALSQIRIPGPRGMRSRQIIQSADLLEVEELDEIVNHLGEKLQERSLQEARARYPSPMTEASQSTDTDTPTEWSKVTAAIPTGPEANMWQIPQGLDLRSAPQCHCQLKTKLYTSMTQKNHQRLFWRCPRGRDQQCRFFQWLDLPKNLKNPPVDFRDDPTLEELRLLFQSQCPHKKTTKQGSNGFRVRETCKECGKVLIDEITETGKMHNQSKDQKAASTSSRSYTPSLAPGTPSPVEEYDYQEFLQWRSQQRGTASGTPCQSWKPPVPVDPIEMIEPEDFQAWQRFKRLQAGSKERRQHR